MSDKLQKQITVELEQLNQLLEMHQSLFDKCEDEVPTVIELSALAATLHAFYTGIENIFKRIALELDGGLPKSELWHRELLDSMMVVTEKRGPVISQPLRAKLREYLGFRHVFRQSYSFQLRWEKMDLLVQSSEETLRQLETELDAFLEAIKK